MIAVVSGVFGAVAGLLLVRPAYRLSVDFEVPARTRCADCDAPVGWLPRRCAGCGRRLGPPAWLVAAVAAVACAGIGWRFGLAWELVPYLGFALLGVLLGAVDLAVLRLPDVLVKPGFAVGAVLLAGVALLDDAWPSLLRAGLAAAALATVYLVLALLPGAQLGYGDVKLAGLLGLFLGWLGWGEVLIGGLLPFLLNGVVALVLLVARRVGRRTLIPYGPAMLVGTWLTVVVLPELR